jgi:NDP-sugar pyrophosphorylase family protein
MHFTNDVDVLILAGGLGTRLRPLIKDTPKALATINEKPFIEILIDKLVENGFERIILCVGYLKDKLIRYVKNRNDCEIIISEENTPLGTAGAIKNAENKIESDSFMVLNGDSFCPLKYKKLINEHNKNGAILTISLVKVENNEDYGSVKVDMEMKITSFKEKMKGSDSYVNAGIYCMDRSLLGYIPYGRIVSLELDIFPELVGDRCFGYVIDGPLIDIGTPDRYKKANSSLMKYI